MTPEQNAAAVELFLRRLSFAEFVARTGIDPVARPEIIESELRGALASQDADTVESALFLGGRFGRLTADLAPLLTTLLLLPWHTQHEDIASTLQGLRLPATADALAQAALVKHDYMDADDSHPFARKCIWALADIGTPEARAHLQSLARADDSEIAGYARRRLDKWDEELGRKGPGARPERTSCWFVRPAAPRPAYWRVAAFLWGPGADFNSDGNSASPDDQEWTELTVSLRPATADHRVDVDPILEQPLTLKVRGTTSELAARAAFFIASTTKGRVSPHSAGPFESPERLRDLLGSIDVDAACARALARAR